MYNVRVKKFLDTMQIRVYSEFVFSNEEKKCSKRKKEYNPFTEQKEVLRTMEELEDNAERSAKVSRSRALNSIYDIARSNEWEWFFTLTFNPEKVNSFDYIACSKKLSDWLHNMKKKVPDMKYLVVPEKHKSGRWHFHGLFANVDSLEFVDSGHVDKKGKIIYNVGNYRLGFSTATKIDDVNRAASYLCKYITKDLCADTKGKKRYWSSKNVDLPVVEDYLFNTREILEELLCTDNAHIKKVFGEIYNVHYIDMPIYKTNPYLSNRYGIFLQIML